MVGALAVGGCSDPEPGVDRGAFEALTSSGEDADSAPDPLDEVLRALALANGSVRPVFETNVVDSQGGKALAYTLMVDAATGKVLYRENKVEHAYAAASEGATQMQGAITATACGPKHEFELTDGNTKQIAVAATAVNPANDIVIKIFGPGGEVLTNGDLGTSPETATYSADKIPAGTYSAQVCPYDSPTVPFVEPGDYVGVITTSDSEGPAVSAPYPPKWTYFTANPALNFSTTHVPGNRVTGCWETRYQGTRIPECDTPPGGLRNLASRAPWDFDFVTGLPTLTTAGNNAMTREAWASPLTPGGAQAPVSPERNYTAEFTDAWQNSKCDPSNLVPGGNDIDASVTNLFVAHNRMHDYSYYLGFTEENYNMQLDNGSRGGVAGELSAQAQASGLDQSMSPESLQGLLGSATFQGTFMDGASNA